MSQFWIMLQMMSISSSCHYIAVQSSSQIVTMHQEINTRLFTGRMPYLSPNQQCQSNEGENYYA